METITLRISDYRRGSSGRRWTFPWVGAIIETKAALKTPFLLNGQPWSRNKTRVRTSQVVVMPSREPAFRLSARPSLSKQHQAHRQAIGLDGNKGWLSEC